MGMSLDAEIMYGMVLSMGDETVVNVPWRKSGDEEVGGDDENEDEDFDGWVVEQLGLEPLDWSTYPETRWYPQEESYTEYSVRSKAHSDAWSKRVGADVYYAKKKELLATVPVEETYGGTEDYHCIVLKLKGSPVINAYYDAVAFDPMTLFVSDDSAAATFLEPFDVKWVGSWLLVPSYG